MRDRKRPKSAPSVRVFEGASIFEAYSQLKKDLGEHAVILSTKTVKKGGILGFWGQKVIQITASEHHSQPSLRKKSGVEKPEASLGHMKGGGVKATSSLVPKGVPALAQDLAPSQASPVPSTSDMGQLKEDLLEIRHMIKEMQDGAVHQHWPDLPPAFQKAYQKLQKLNVSEDIARALIHRWKAHYPNFKKGQRADVKLLESYIGEMLIPAGPIQLKEKGPTVVMMVGPTGVGKTTSVAKLAAQHKIKEKRRVALITVDTYRIAAVEQLKTYADLIGLPFKVVSSADELKGAVDSFSDRDVVFIDSAGRSPRNQEKMKELRSYVEASGADELHLVLSVSVGAEVMKDTLERYENFPVQKILLTKLDEAVYYGSILSIIARMQKPIGYLTVGQEVPDDIELATQKRLSRLILGLDKIHD
jgi:flagellar biosynthesis protein FlhF